MEMFTRRSSTRLVLLKIDVKVESDEEGKRLVYEQDCAERYMPFLDAREGAFAKLTKRE
jgi:hypothetical protein